MQKVLNRISLKSTPYKTEYLSTTISAVLRVCKQLKEGNVLFNDALNTFYLRLCGVGHMVKDHSDSVRGSPLPPHGLLFASI